MNTLVLIGYIAGWVFLSVAALVPMHKAREAYLLPGGTKKLIAMLLLSVAFLVGGTLCAYGWIQIISS
tara:strand:+ start:142 stop:345 length:204 start_codon:yes stop_codon:yes gene_type:complete